MGEARRRKRSRAELTSTIPPASQDVWKIRIYAPEIFDQAALDPALITDDLAYDGIIVARAIDQIMRHSDTLCPVCLLCSTCFGAASLPHRFVVLRPSIDIIQLAARRGLKIIANGICCDCGAKPELPACILDYYRRAFPDLYEIIQLTSVGVS